METLTIVSACEESRGAVNQKNYIEQAIRLVYSLRKNGGVYKDAKVVFCYGKDYKPSDEICEYLSKQNCEFVEVEMIDNDYFPSIKVSACSLSFQTDYAMWIDTDVYIRKDFSEIIEFMFFNDIDIAVSPVSFAHHRWARKEDAEELKMLYKAVGIEWRERKCFTHIDRKESNFYFSSGIIIFRTQSNFSKCYREVYYKIRDKVDRSSSRTQVALAIAIDYGKLKVLQLPERYHYVYATRNHRLIGDPYIVHYQDNIVKEIPAEDWFIYEKIKGRYETNTYMG